MPQNLAECTDEEIAWGVHFLDGHMDDLDPQELRAFRIIRQMILQRVAAKRELDADDSRQA
jgi:hypothetical protein